LFHDFRNFALWMPGCNLALKYVYRSNSGGEWQRPEGRVGSLNEVANKSVAEVSKHRKGYADVQGAPRFPIKLPVAVKSGVGGEKAETQNISANGVLFRIDADVPVGSAVDFTISLPADVVGAAADVQVDCRGRVIRCFQDGDRRAVGVVIDEYRFERR
jgi:PilZ domain